MAHEVMALVSPVSIIKVKKMSCGKAPYSQNDTEKGGTPPLPIFRGCDSDSSMECFIDVFHIS